MNLSSNGTDLAVDDLHDGALEQCAFTDNMGPVFAFSPDFAAQASLYRLDPSTLRTVTSPSTRLNQPKRPRP